MVIDFFKKTISLAGVAGALCIAATATPAFADTKKANAEEVTTVKTTAVSTVANKTTTREDGQFRKLFARWTALDEVKTPSTINGAPAPVAPSGSVSVPSRTPLNNSHMSSGYGMRTHPVIGGRRRHNGVDLAAKRGTPIYATADGTVSRANRFGSYGNYISIEHGGEIQTRYAHLSRISVRFGDQVKKGELIGYVGSTGRSTGPHLHYEVRIAGKSVNPMPYMTETKAQAAFAVAKVEGGKGGQ